MNITDKKHGKLKTVFVKWLFLGFFTSITLLLMLIFYILEKI